MNYDNARCLALWSLWTAGAKLDDFNEENLITATLRGRDVRVIILKSAAARHVLDEIASGRLIPWEGSWNIVVLPAADTGITAGAAIERAGMVPCVPGMLQFVLALNEQVDQPTA